MLEFSLELEFLCCGVVSLDCLDILRSFMLANIHIAVRNTIDTISIMIAALRISACSYVYLWVVIFYAV